HELFRGNPATVHAQMPEHMQAVFDSAAAIEYAGEIVLAKTLLGLGEAAVISAGGAERAVLHGLPERRLVLARPVRRAHHVARDEIEVGVPIHRVIDGEETGQCLADHLHAAATGLRYRSRSFGRRY